MERCIEFLTELWKVEVGNRQFGTKRLCVPMPHIIQQWGVGICAKGMALSAPLAQDKGQKGHPHQGLIQLGLLWQVLNTPALSTVFFFPAEFSTFYSSNFFSPFHGLSPNRDSSGPPLLPAARTAPGLAHPLP